MAKEPQPTDLDQKLIALRRRTAGASSRKEKTDRMPSSAAASSSKPPPPLEPLPDTTADDFSRRLRISSKPPSKLYNPDRDPIPTIRRTAEPETSSDVGSGAHPPRRDVSSGARQLFDHRKDDPVRFSVMARPPNASGSRPPPTPKSSGEYVSASSASSYAPSQASTFTLSSTTDGSSASSALFDKNSRDQQPTNLINVQLKRLYREISELENKIKVEDAEDPAEDMSRTALKGKGKGKHPNPNEEDDIEREKWKSQIAHHKRLVETIHNFFEISLAPSAPASLRVIPTKYNIIVRLWNYGFFKLLESLRRSSFVNGSRIAHEHLQDFLIYAYTFYTGLLEEPMLEEYRHGWLEALGDLARFQMAISVRTTANATSGPPEQLTTANLSSHASLAPPLPAHPVILSPDRRNSKSGFASSHSPPPPAPQLLSASRVVTMDASLAGGSRQAPPDTQQSPSLSLPPPSVGLAAARMMELEPEKELWRRIARDWYGMGLGHQPGNGKLHHHLGLLGREGLGEGNVDSASGIDELKAVYHFVKSMTTLHPFPLSRESILPLWSPQLQQHRQRANASFIETFILLHGMLFTHIQLDDFNLFLQRLVVKMNDKNSHERIEEKDWVMMGIVNIGAVLEYGRGGGVKDGQQRSRSRRGEDGNDKMDIDDDGRGETPQISSQPSLSQTYLHALKLTMVMLTYTFRHPLRRPTAFARLGVNPYLTVVLTFLTTILKNPPVSAIIGPAGATAGITSAAGRVALERSVPWRELSAFMSGVPRGVMASQGLVVKGAEKDYSSTGHDESGWTMLTSGCSPPLPEDWCLRGMEWVGRKVYERGFWKGSGLDGEKGAEVEYLAEREGGWGEEDGIVEDDDEATPVGGSRKSADDKLRKRWIRIIRCVVGISEATEGFRWIDGTREWRIDGPLEERVERWAEEDRVQEEEEELRKFRRMAADDDMDVDQDEAMQADGSSEDEDDELDSNEVKALKARRRYLKSLLGASDGSAPRHTTKPSRGRRSAQDSQVLLPIRPGYTVLIVDTNLLLSSLPSFAALVESRRWTIIVPLPVIMELDGLSATKGPLGEAAKSAADYVGEKVKTYSLSLKVQTSRGNYLSGLTVRREDVDFTASSGRVKERNMDDLILRTAMCHQDQWVDRSAMLQASEARTLNDVQGEPVKVILLSLDRNLRLKSRSQQLPAASEKDLAGILAFAT